MARLPIEHIRNGLLTDPSVYPQNLSLASRAILFIRLQREELAAASFLDDRILTPQTQGQWVRLSELQPLLEDAAPCCPLHFIFHAGHVGSTLVSRLIEEANGALVLREPLPLRVLADAADTAEAAHALASQAEVQTLLRWFAVLWARGYADTRVAILKATSAAGRLGPALLAIAPRARALYLNLKPEPYLATLLSGENSYLDLRGHGPERYKRLARLAGPAPTPLYAMSLGELAALTWLTETLTQQQAQRAAGGRVLMVDFDAFLADPEGSMRGIVRHFGIEASETFLAGVANSRTFTRYSKAPERSYSADLRAQLLAQARAMHAEELRKGLDWLDQFARRSSVAALALSA